MERVSSPEQLGDYIRVTSPGMWMVMGAVVLLLASGSLVNLFAPLLIDTDGVLFGSDAALQPLAYLCGRAVHPVQSWATKADEEKIREFLESPRYEELKNQLENRKYDPSGINQFLG